MVSIPWVEGRTGGSAAAPGVATSRKVRAREPQGGGVENTDGQRMPSALSMDFTMGQVKFTPPPAMHRPSDAE